MVNTEVALEEGLKQMWEIMFKAYIMQVRVYMINNDKQEWSKFESDLTASFLGGLRRNGYEIRPIEE